MLRKEFRRKIMTPLQIKEQIDKNNKLIEQILNPSEFTLNNAVRELLAKNTELQAQCPHSFVDGFCEYCYLMEEKANG
jgi:hypothetical protein